MKEIVETLLVSLALVILVVFSFPTGLACDSHSIDGRARFSCWDVCVFSLVRFFPSIRFPSSVLCWHWIVVDDAIIVVRRSGATNEGGLRPRTAALKA